MTYLNFQEGFLLGEVTSEITNHISDAQSGHARLDTQISIKSILPLPSVSLFYCSTGRIKEDILAELLSDTADMVVGWYKYRQNCNIKPTLRDKLISKGLQKYFEKHDKNAFASCHLSHKKSICSSTHTFTYRFGKINNFDMYEYIEDATGNLGEKTTGYKKAPRSNSHNVFNRIVTDSNVQNKNTSEAILHIQEAVNNRLLVEARKAVKHAQAIKELEAEIEEMSVILGDYQAKELESSYEELVNAEKSDIHKEMANACVEALNSPPPSSPKIIEVNVEECGESSRTKQRITNPIKIINNSIPIVSNSVSILLLFTGTFIEYIFSIGLSREDRNDTALHFIIRTYYIVIRILKERTIPLVRSIHKIRVFFVDNFLQ